MLCNGHFYKSLKVKSIYKVRHLVNVIRISVLNNSIV